MMRCEASRYINCLQESEKINLTAKDIAPLLGVDPQQIRLQAHEAPDKLGFPVIVIGTRVKIPCYSFLAYAKEVYGL